MVLVENHNGVSKSNYDKEWSQQESHTVLNMMKNFVATQADCST